MWLGALARNMMNVKKYSKIDLFLDIYKTENVCVLIFNPISGRGGCFYPPLGFFLNISQTVWARILKFSDFS